MEKGYLGIRKEITFLIKYAGRSHRIYKENSLAGVMFNVLVSCAIDRGFCLLCDRSWFLSPVR